MGITSCSIARSARRSRNSNRSAARGASCAGGRTPCARLAFDMAAVRTAFALCVALATVAHAEEPEDLDASYLYDGGAVPLFWGPVLLGSALAIGLPPRDRPFGFDITEGGEVKSTWHVPAWAIAGLGVGTVGGIVASGDAS